MEISPVEQRFNAAVNVIRGLPKNGSYQPSNNMMLQFYSYYKQATLGPCTQRKPPFWDVVSKAKYDSWKALGKMTRERAMELYVDELKKIIETMSYTDNVAEFMGSINELNGVDVDDLEVVAPEIIKKVRSNPNSPFASREASPTRAPKLNGNGVIVNGNGNYHNSEESLRSNGHGTSEYSDDEYIDTVEDESISVEPLQSHLSRSTTRPLRMGQLQNGVITLPSSNESSLTFNQILHTMERMRVDLEQINQRITIVERSLTEVKNHQLRKKIMELKHPKWWPFAEISPSWFVFMLLCPLVMQRLVSVMQRRRR